MSEIILSQRTLGELLSQKDLHIPHYQRPYKWERKHIRNLFYDVRDAMDKGEYQVGSVILHDQEMLDIVDGQQRLISVALFLYALGRLDNYDGARKLLSQQFGDISCQHAQENNAEWQQLIALDGEKAGQVCDFLLDRCKVSVITIPGDRLAEAFQLFDSQNNRGKSLEPHDLLKAYHLRHISEPTEETIVKWEAIVDDETLTLKQLFDKHLFRMRRWSRGETGLTKKRHGAYLRFTESFIDDFKGVDLAKYYPYLHLYKELQDHQISLPMSLNMPIINGEAFFEYVTAGHEKIKAILSLRDLVDNLNVNPNMLSILSSRQVKFSRSKNLFDNLLALFVDRFGSDELTVEVVETIFIWAYYPRISQSRMSDITLANYAAGGRFRNQHDAVQKLFQVLGNSISPTDFLQKIDRSKFEYKTVQDIVEKLHDS